MPATQGVKLENMPASQCLQPENMPASQCLQPENMPASQCLQPENMPASQCLQPENMPATQRVQLLATSCSEQQAGTSSRKRKPRWKKKKTSRLEKQGTLSDACSGSRKRKPRSKKKKLSGETQETLINAGSGSRPPIVDTYLPFAPEQLQPFLPPSCSARILIKRTPNRTCAEILNSKRSWQKMRQADVKTGAMELKIMTYNILAQDLIEPHIYLYTRCRDTDLQWVNRGATLLTQILAHNADILCLQEVEQYHWMHDIRDTLAEQGYAGVYKKQTGDNSHGCAILFKASKFELLKSIPVEFQKGGILDRHNIGLILLLQPHKQVYGGKVQKICVATTHLLYNPRSGDVKLAQLIVLLAEIDRYAYLDDQPESVRKCCPVNDSSKLDQAAACEPQLKNTYASAGYCPIILCGDFNAEPLSDLYQFLTTGYLKYEDCISRLLCGQEEGRWGGSDRLLDRKLLPTSLNICETCQYLHVLNERPNRAGEGGRGLLPKINSGEVWHGMNFQSVYSHCVRQGHGEITTYHNNCCSTVDYIFYSQTGPRRAHVTLSSDLENGDSRAAQLDDSQLNMQGDSQLGMQGDSQLGMQGDSQLGMQGDSQLGMQGGSDNSPDAHTDMTAAVLDMDRPTFIEPLELVARYRLLTKNEVTKHGFMPNSVFPSDHLCLIAKFLLR